MPNDDFIDSPSMKDFSNERAQNHVKEISKTFHYCGTEEHKQTQNYIVSELQDLGLNPHIQTGYTFSEWGTFVYTENIIARIKGSGDGKAVAVMTHYDSVPYSSYGASDAGSGVATILEGIRAFIAHNSNHKNDIIILINDAEELGLNGAKLFVDEHEWREDIGIILNFEARGSGGPSFTLLETNDGNKGLVDEFTKANPKFPVANSLAYSIYKKMPNDTDLTVFRKEANIQGFNFAFIDDHYDYHTSLDTAERLDNNSLSHQASYLVPLLNYFSNSDLERIKSKENVVYFNSPLGLYSYSYKWIIPLVLMTCVLFLVLLAYGFKTRNLKSKEIGKGYIGFILALVVNGCIGWFGWQVILSLYPDYSEILQGFTYNGHSYILGFCCLAFAITTFIYKKLYTRTNTKELIIAPLSIWIIINIGIAFELEGASFFIIPVLISLLVAFLLQKEDKHNLILYSLLMLPAIFIYVPFIQQFPIALGLKIIAGSCVLLTLVYGLLLPVFGFIRRKKLLGYLSLIVAGSAFLHAHFNSTPTPETPRPNSLVYYQNNDTNTSYWLTYDKLLDSWNSPYFNTLDQDSIELSFNSKHKSMFTKKARAKTINVPVMSQNITLDTIIGNTRNIICCLTPKRRTNTVYIKSDNKSDIKTMTINGKPIITNLSNRFFGRESKTIANCYIKKGETLELNITGHKDSIPNIEILDVSFDLLDNKDLNIAKRPSHMIPKGFTVNDATIVKKTLNFKVRDTSYLN